MAKCELCEGPHAVRLLMIDDLESHCTLCYSCTGPDAHLRVRARRAEAGHTNDTIPAPPICDDPPRSHEAELSRAVARLAPECRECSRPERPIAATMGDECCYCHLRVYGSEKNQRRMMDLKGADARARMDAADRKAQPRATAESRMLALPHPWECGGEDEP